MTNSKVWDGLSQGELWAVGLPLNPSCEVGIPCNPVEKLLIEPDD